MESFLLQFSRISPFSKGEMYIRGTKLLNIASCIKYRGKINEHNERSNLDWYRYDTCHGTTTSRSDVSSNSKIHLMILVVIQHRNTFGEEGIFLQQPPITWLSYTLVWCKIRWIAAQKHVGKLPNPPVSYCQRFVLYGIIICIWLSLTSSCL